MLVYEHVQHRKSEVDGIRLLGHDECGKLG